MRLTGPSAANGYAVSPATNDSCGGQATIPSLLVLERLDLQSPHRDLVLVALVDGLVAEALLRLAGVGPGDGLAGIRFVNRVTRPAASERGGNRARRRIDRQLALIERLHAAGGARVRLGRLAVDLGVSVRTVVRDVERLRLGGVPIGGQRGPGGGVCVLPTRSAVTVVFALPDATELISSLAKLGPTVGAGAASALHRLADALDPAVRAGRFSSR